jgi:hypothetical protein
MGPEEKALALRRDEAVIQTTAATSATSASRHCHMRMGEPFLK